MTHFFCLEVRIVARRRCEPVGRNDKRRLFRYPSRLALDPRNPYDSFAAGQTQRCRSAQVGSVEPAARMSAAAPEGHHPHRTVVAICVCGRLVRAAGFVSE